MHVDHIWKRVVKSMVSTCPRRKRVHNTNWNQNFWNRWGSVNYRPCWRLMFCLISSLMIDMLVTRDDEWQMTWPKQQNLLLTPRSPQSPHERFKHWCDSFYLDNLPSMLSQKGWIGNEWRSLNNVHYSFSFSNTSCEYANTNRLNQNTWKYKRENDKSNNSKKVCLYDNT